MGLRYVWAAGLAALALTPGAALAAGAREDVEAGSARCAAIADDRTWLDCYYGAAQPLRAQLGLPPVPASQLALVPPPGPGGYASPPPAYAAAPPQATERPGFFTRLVTPTFDKPEPPTHMTSYKFDAGGFFTVTLANGETWRQIHGDTTVASWKRPADSYAVVILPAQNLANTKRMQVGKNEFYLVERVG